MHRNLFIEQIDKIQKRSTVKSVKLQKSFYGSKSWSNFKLRCGIIEGSWTVEISTRIKRTLKTDDQPAHKVNPSHDWLSKVQRDSFYGANWDDRKLWHETRTWSFPGTLSLVIKRLRSKLGYQQTAIAAWYLEAAAAWWRSNTERYSQYRTLNVGGRCRCRPGGTIDNTIFACKCRCRPGGSTIDNTIFACKCW